MARALINVPKTAKRGDVIEIKALLSHPMETGYRHDEVGRAVPRDIINLFVCKYNDVEVFRAELFPAIAANPFLTFTTIATESGGHCAQLDRRRRQHPDRKSKYHGRMNQPRDRLAHAHSLCPLAGRGSG